MATTTNRHEAALAVPLETQGRPTFSKYEASRREAVFQVGPVTYKVRRALGGRHEVKVEAHGNAHLDSLDLSGSSSRARFCNAAEGATGVVKAAIDGHLVYIRDWMVETKGSEAEVVRRGNAELDRERFARFLYAIRDDVGKLAVLKRGVGRPIPNIDQIMVLSKVMPAGDEAERRAYYAVAALFATHPMTGGYGDFGRSLGRADVSKERLRVLLGSSSENIPMRLAQVMPLVKNSKVPVDWRRLLDDLIQWGSRDLAV